MKTPSAAKASSPAAALPLLLIILIDSMGFAMLTPLLAAELAPDSKSAIGAGLSEDARYIIYGVATGLYPMMMFFGAPILGQVSDRVGRKLMLLVCAGGIVLSYATLSAAFTVGSVVLVMIGRALGGTTAASQPISLAALVDVSAPDKRDFWLSMGLLASSVGFVVGPALSGLLSDSSIVSWFSTQTPLFATVALGALNFLLLFFLYREPRKQTTSANRAPLSLLSGLHSLAHAFQRPGLRRVSTVFLLQEMAWGAYFFFIPHFVMDRFDATITESSLFMAVMGIGFCISFAVAMPLLTKRFSAHAITVGSLFVTGAFIVVSTFAPNMIVQWSVILPISVATAVSYGALIILFTDLSTEDTKGEIMGITAAINALAFGTISFVGGALTAIDEKVPLIVSFVLMFLSWVVLDFRRPKAAVVGTSGSPARVAEPPVH
jgi:DHA1 family tetracycline resistance protein-like MFS transporter